MVRHTLNGVEIEEPIGFDKFKSIIKRTDHHGVSIEMSVGELEFYGEAAEIIKEAYNTDIDIELTYVVESSSNGIDYEEEICGVVDLSSYDTQESDYCSVKCKVGEVGVKTTFNNRIDTKVDINSEQSLEGANLPVYPNLKRNMVIPAKGILYKSVVETVGDVLGSGDGSRFGYIAPAFNSAGVSEINFIRTYDENIFFLNVDFYQVENIDGVQSLTLKYNIDFDINGGESDNLRIKLEVSKLLGTSKSLLYVSGETNITSSTGQPMQSISYNGELVVSDFDKIQIAIRCLSADGLHNCLFKTKNGSFISVEYISLLDSSKSNLSFVHESLSRVSEIISGLTVKSDWYGRDDSNVNDTQNTYGGGSLKALFPGFWLRNALNTNGEEYKFEISFKDLIGNLNAIDNIGWGFSTENGNLFIRVERWDWFYKNNVILELNNPKSKKRTLNPSKIFTRLNVGYDKYGDTNDINSMDTFHTKREYSTKLKAVDNEINAVSKFIACPYAIEFTRRKSLDKTTEDWKYDENTFILCVAKIGASYSIEVGVTDSDKTIISPDTLVNVRISPLRNAVRWSERFFEVNRYNHPALNIIASTGNISAKCKPIYDYDDTCEDSIIGIGNEGGNVDYKAPKLKPEILEVQHILTREQHKLIKQDPYGIIKIDGESCWLESIERDLNTSESILKLIPKNE